MGRFIEEYNELLQKEYSLVSEAKKVVDSYKGDTITTDYKNSDKNIKMISIWDGETLTVTLTGDVDSQSIKKLEDFDDIDYLDLADNIIEYGNKNK